MVKVQKKTAAEWLALNPTLRVGEQGFERDTKRTKVGDGLTPWRDLSYQFNKVMADALYAPLSAVGPALREDPSDLGTFLIIHNRLVEDAADPGTYLISV